MIFVDANVFLRFLVEPVNDHLRQQQQIAIQMLQPLVTGDEEGITSEVVLHEVCYVLTSPRQYGLSPADAINKMRAVLSWPGWAFPAADHQAYLRALDLWEAYPSLEFSDAVIAARCEAGTHLLASFDRHFDTVPSISRYRLPQA